MQRRADLFFQQLKDKKVTFIGMGVSHFECIKLFAQKGIRVTVADKRTAAQLGEKQEELAGLGVRFALGEEYLEHLSEADIIFRTPGDELFFTCALKSKRTWQGCDFGNGSLF